MQIKKYKKDFIYSFTLGAFPTFELLINKPQAVTKVIAHPAFNDMDKLKELCYSKNIFFEVNEKLLAKISDKEVCYAAGVFNKYSDNIDPTAKAHVVLHNPSDMGNIGTIIRTMLAFGFKNLAIISPCADIFNPKTIRASMGAIFKVNICIFNSFEEYESEFCNNRDIYPFMLSSKNNLSLDNCPKTNNYALVFGNEARGLPNNFEKYTSVFIPQSDDVDSLNLAISVALGTFVFSSINGV